METAGALGAYRDALALVDAVREHAGPDGPAAPAGPARRPADGAGRPGGGRAPTGRRSRVTTGTEHRLVRARLARAAAFGGTSTTARAALAGLELEGDAADGPILLARGNLAYFTGDVDDRLGDRQPRRASCCTPDDPWHLVDLVALQGLIAHQRGEWFERFRIELRRTQGKQRLATALFDAHLCVAEYLLYGPVPTTRSSSEAEELRRRADQAGRAARRRLRHRPDRRGGAADG